MCSIMNINVYFVVLIINVNAFILSIKFHYLKYSNDLIIIELIYKNNYNLYKNFIL